MGEMEVRNPIFDEDDDALSTTSSLNTKDKNNDKAEIEKDDKSEAENGDKVDKRA